MSKTYCFCTSAEVSRWEFYTEMFWVRSVLGPKCPYTFYTIDIFGVCYMHTLKHVLHKNCSLLMSLSFSSDGRSLYALTSNLSTGSFADVRYEINVTFFGWCFVIAVLQLVLWDTCSRVISMVVSLFTLNRCQTCFWLFCISVFYVSH